MRGGVIVGDARIQSGGGLVVGATSAQSPGTGRIMMKEASAPGAPASGFGIIWCNTSGELWFKNDAGTATKLA